MRRIGDGLTRYIAGISGHDEAASRALRRATVHRLWEETVAAVFREAAPLVLDHTNAVYIMSAEKGNAVRRFDRPASDVQGCAATGNVLVVCLDDSMVRSELDNRQELVKMKFREKGEPVEALKIVPSIRDMKQRHPFRRPAGQPVSPGAPLWGAEARNDGRILSSPAREALSDRQASVLSSAAEKLDDARLRKAFEKAMIASRETQNQ